MKEILELMIQLEDDVSLFYQRLASMKKMQEFEALFKFMSEHSHEHSLAIREIAEKISEIPLNKQKYLKLENKLKNKLLQEIPTADHVAKLSDMLADAEGIMGYAYDQIAGHMEMAGHLMLNSAKTVRRIAKEEQEHKQKVFELGHLPKK